MYLGQNKSPLQVTIFEKLYLLLAKRDISGGWIFSGGLEVPLEGWELMSVNLPLYHTELKESSISAGSLLSKRSHSNSRI